MNMMRLYGSKINEDMEKVYNYDSEELGFLKGIVNVDGVNLIAVINHKTEWVKRDAIVEKEKYLNGEEEKIEHRIILSSEEEFITGPLFIEIIDSIKSKSDLSEVRHGEINVNIGFYNRVYVAEKEVFEYFKELQKKHPNMPLKTAKAIEKKEIIPYKKKNIKKIRRRFR